MVICVLQAGPRFSVKRTERCSFLSKQVRRTPRAAPCWDAGASRAPAPPAQPPYGKVIGNEAANGSKGEKTPASLKTRAPSPLSVPAAAPPSIPTSPGERAPLRTRIRGAGSSEETSSDVSGKNLSVPGKKLSETMERNAGSILRSSSDFYKETGSAWPAGGSQKHRKRRKKKSFATTERRNAETHSGRADHRNERVNVVTAHGASTAKGKLKVSHQIRQPD